MLLLSLMIVSPFAQSEMYFQSSRVVFAADSKQVNFLISNKYPYPVMIMSWVDDGQSQSPVDFKGSPVIPYPATQRILGGSTEYLKLMNTYADLKNKRTESLFWLNIQTIAPKANATASNDMDVSILTKFKLFYRPASLKENVSEVVNKVTYSVATETQSVTVNNPTPYYITFRKFAVDGTPALSGFMVAPESSKNVEMQKNILSHQTVNYIIIDDDGQFVAGEGIVK
jgi:P pilus assembly chaperone PapD